MLLIDIPEMEWDETQLVYHALGRLGIEALVLTRSKSPYVCVGFSGGIPSEVDAELCAREGIGIFIEREQLLIQLVIKRDRDDVPAGQHNFFKRFLKPLVEVYSDIGIDAEFRPINDLLVRGRKISGTGGGEVGSCNVLATNILLDFNFDTMASVLLCHSENFRRALREGLEGNMTTVKREIPSAPSYQTLRRLVAKRYEDLLGRMETSPLPAPVKKAMKALRKEFFAEKWLSDRGVRRDYREVKLREGAYLAQLPTPKGDILVKSSNGKIVSAESVEGARWNWQPLIGKDFDGEQIINIVSRMGRH
jgi:lipoate-protein ligase A